MPQKPEGIKKPGKVYWLINMVILGIASFVFLLDLVVWRRFSLSLMWMIITGGVAVFCYVQLKSIDDSAEGKK
ncbi:MAG: hypothetical protein ACOX29_11045 [Bacillota bacterium]|jgi:uncharacterized membrane-anchored protein YitT (DUF2179 family)|nr:hypothetical protein [Bacillota bacterium]NLU54109.1 hypothetical protein [Bacillota bacterium]HOA91799.1 hypothetical protein [Bacillota bacterium]HOL13347.1 hypothetical protein [Bacillota bacterium]HOP53333.1 hypothetical protein [Bacillota bacterium]